jgi:hypothetical protein
MFKKLKLTPALAKRSKCGISEPQNLPIAQKVAKSPNTIAKITEVLKSVGVTAPMF